MVWVSAGLRGNFLPHPHGDSAERGQSIPTFLLATSLCKPRKPAYAVP